MIYLSVHANVCNVMYSRISGSGIIFVRCFSLLELEAGGGRNSNNCLVALNDCETTKR